MGEAQHGRGTLWRELQVNAGSVPHACGTERRSEGREVVPFHEALEGGAVHPEGLGRMADVSIMVLEHLREELLFHSLERLLLPLAEAVSASMFAVVHDRLG